MLLVTEYFANSLKVIGNSTIQQITYEFLLAFHSIITVALSTIISKIKRYIGQKLQFFSEPRAFDAPARVVPDRILP